MDALGGLALDLREINEASAGKFSFYKSEAARCGATTLGPSLPRLASIRMTDGCTAIVAPCGFYGGAAVVGGSFPGFRFG